MTPPVTRSGLFTMGSVCSCITRSKSRLSRVSLTAEHGPKQSNIESTDKESNVKLTRISRADTSTADHLYLTPERSVTYKMTGIHAGSSTSYERSAEGTEISLQMPPCVVPPQLKTVPTEMQNLLMGRWPALPTPGSRVIRLYVAGEETDSQTERMWLTRNVFPELRYFTETLGFHLHIVDTHALVPTPCTPRSQMRAIIRHAIEEGIDLWLILLNSKLGWNLPSTIEATDYIDIQQRLANKDSDMGAYMARCYKLDENNIPPVYYLLHNSTHSSDSQTHQMLFDELCYIVTEDQYDLYMVEGFPEEVAMALARHSSMMDNVLVVRRTINCLPKELTHKANRNHLDVDSDGETHQQLLQRYRHMVSRVERIVSNECILKFSTSWADLEMALNGTLTSYIKQFCDTVQGKLKAAVSRMVERHTSIDPYLAAGLPPVLCQELLMHAHKQHHILAACPRSPEIVFTALDRLDKGCTRPLILFGSMGSGLQTIAAHLSLEKARRDTTHLVALRFMTLTPESQTAMAVLFTVLEQVSITIGGEPIFERLTNLTCASILARMAECTSAEHPLTIILCDLQWGMMGRGLDLDTNWLTLPLPPNIRLVLVTYCTQINALAGPQQQMEVPMIPFERAMEIFSRRMKSLHRTVTSQQYSLIMNVLRKSPVPVHAVLLSCLASEWRSHDTYREKDMPPTLESTLQQLMVQSEKVVGKDCVAVILGYLSAVKFGLSDSELEDILAIDNKLMAALYPTQLPAVRHCPLSIWLYLRHKFSPAIDVAYVYGHRVYRWQRPAYCSLVLSYFRVSVEQLHAQLAEYFIGTWADKPKPLPDPSSSQGKATTQVMCSVMKQPDSYERYTNCRKFLCLLHHMLQGLPSGDMDKYVMQQRIAAAKEHLLNLRWLVIKLDATSLVQLLDDLQMAISNAATMSKELSWLQLMVVHHARALNVSGLQLRTHLHTEIDQIPGKSTSNQHQKESFWESIQKLDETIVQTSLPFLICQKGPTDPSMSTTHVNQADGITQNLDPSPSTNTSPDIAPNACPKACLNGFISRENDGKHVVSISTLAGEIVEWDTEKNCVVKKLTGINKPSDFVFLDSRRIVVLCNRELKAYDLETGALVSNIRGMLNIKMPYFHVRDGNTVIVLARNRMSVNVLDVNTGQIHATFKAGEDRFLNSLLVSNNGRMLVCGDETQKPSPLLVWELGQSKLLHDLRLPQHEFITSIADITHSGQYLACACKGLYDSANNFVVVYDLLSGQLYRQFRLGSSVTAVSVASTTLEVVMTLNDGFLAVFEIVSGNCKSHIDGVKAIYNRIQLTRDETMAITYSINAGSMPIACTVAFWNISTGQFLASYTFDSMVTCIQHVAHNNTILVGLSNCRYYMVLTLYAKPSENLTYSSGSNIPFHKVSEQPLWRIV